MIFPITAIAQNQDEKDYVIGPGDILDIKVWDHEDLNRLVEVSEEGSFMLSTICLR
jgi:protein involved in polysaccharide export with SLBB domain